MSVAITIAFFHHTNQTQLNRINKHTINSRDNYDYCLISMTEDNSERILEERIGREIWGI